MLRLIFESSRAEYISARDGADSFEKVKRGIKIERGTGEGF